MQLPKWIVKNGGDSVVAKRLGVSRQRVRSWRVDAAKPRPAMAYRLYKLGKGRLSKKAAAGEV